MHHQALLRQFSTPVIVVWAGGGPLYAFWNGSSGSLEALSFWYIGVRAQAGLSFADGRTGRSFTDGSFVVDGVMA
jgi:hypothetical protein